MVRLINVHPNRSFQTKLYVRVVGSPRSAIAPEKILYSISELVPKLNHAFTGFGLMEKNYISLIISKIEKNNLTMISLTKDRDKSYSTVNKETVKVEELKKSIEEKKKKAEQQTPVKK